MVGARAGEPGRRWGAVRRHLKLPIAIDPKAPTPLHTSTAGARPRRARPRASARAEISPSLPCLWLPLPPCAPTVSRRRSAGGEEDEND
jgi:hypothetical protein